METREEEGVTVSSTSTPTTGKISTEVSTDVKMEVLLGSVLLENEVLAIFL
jgi:hypothetical protein